MIKLRPRISEPKAFARKCVWLLPAAILGCDPVITIAGASFPAWLLCLLAGAALAALMRLIFVAFDLEPYLGPLPIIYSSMVLMFALIVWTIFFNRL